MDILKTLIDKIKSNEIDKESAKEIIQTLDSEIEELKKSEEEEEAYQRDLASKEWAENMQKARAKQQKKMKVRQNLRFQKGISPARLVRLRRLGKLDD